MITDATDDNARPPEMSGNAELSGTVDNTAAATVDNTAAETIRYLATQLQEARRKLKANGRPAPASWRDYILGQTERSLSIEQSDKRRALIVEALASVAPKDAVEDMIAAQMLACHDAAMECFGYIPEEEEKDPYYRTRYLLLGSKLSRAFAMLLDALTYRRNKGQHRIVVEHVDVHSGGQAVVGNISSSSTGTH